MCSAGPFRHDGSMTDETHPPSDRGAGTATDEPHLDAARLRTLADVQRPVDDRLVGGVCTGVARYLDLDPVVVRIGCAVLTFVGGAGLVLYAGAWLLLPTTEEPSPAAQWFRLGENEPKVRTAGLLAAGLVAALVAIGDGGWGRSGWGGPWLLIVLAGLAYILVIRPRRRRDIDDSPHQPLPSLRTDPHLPAPHTGRERPTRSGALTGLTLSVSAIAIAVTRLLADRSDGAPWTLYVAVALTVVALGILLSTFVGDGAWLIAIGLILAVVLGVGSLLPSPRVGDLQVRPTTTVELEQSYEHGVGQMTVDLSTLTDPDALLGRSLDLRTGVGQTVVVVPGGLNVEVRTKIGLGQVQVFDRMVNGTSTELDLSSDPGPRLTVDIQQGVGDIEVVRR